MQQKAEALIRLRRCLADLGNVPESRNDGSGSFERWHRATRVAVEHTFGDGSKQAQEFSRISYHPTIVTQHTTDQDRQRAHSNGLKRAEQILGSLIDEVEEYWPSVNEQETEEVGYEYDVCLSFAGEDRQYVYDVAEALKKRGIRVFYDKYEEVALWGKDLYQHLGEIYRRRARYCVLFISAAYAKKLWTKHELRSAQSRAFAEHAEYILPARFDDTELPGVRPTIGYVDLRQRHAVAFAEVIAQKIGGKRSAVSDVDGLGANSPVVDEPLFSLARPLVAPIRPWFTSVRTRERGVVCEDAGSPLKAFVAPFRNDPTPAHPRISPVGRLSATVWLEAIPDFRVTGHWLESESSSVRLGVGEQWLLVIAVITSKVASLVADNRRGTAGAVELKQFWMTPTNVAETVAVVSVVGDDVLLGQYRYRLKLAPPFIDISLILA